jgi:hypothetical protein
MVQDRQRKLLQRLRRDAGRQLVLSGSDREGPVGAALRVPSYAAPPLDRQATYRENQSLSKLPGLSPSTTSETSP